MARGAWISDDVRERIVQMRNDGVPVKDIAELLERSTNYIYRILRKMNGIQPNKKKQKTGDSPTIAPAMNVAHGEERRDRLLDDFSDHSAALLCAVENMEVSAYEPIPMPKSVKNSEQLPPRPPVHQDAVNANISFSVEASTGDKHHVAPPSDEIWILTDTSSSVSRSADPKTIIPSSDTSRQDQLQVQPLTPLATEKPSAPDPSAQTSSLMVNLRVPVAKNKPKSSAQDIFGDLGHLLQPVQDEIQRLTSLAQSDLYDAQLLQMLKKFHAEMQLLKLKKTLSASKLSMEGADNLETSHLFRQKLSEEITLLRIQVDRERLELERERIRHKTASTICRKTLLKANAASIDVNELFPRQ